jgi:predicted  nucleic acid-binding Zn-ribbon protein
MPLDLVALLKLQERDLRLQELRKQLDRIPREQEQARTRLADNEAAVRNAKHAVNENEVAIKNVELDIGVRRETVARLQRQQFETRKNEEYRALGTEVTRYTAEVDQFETRELELMERGDGLRSVLAVAEAALAVTKAGVDEETAVLQTRFDNFSKEVALLEIERRELTGAINEDHLSLYERLLKLRGAPVVVQISPSRQCVGCHVRATPATMVRVQTGHDLVNCENCGRILYPE